MKNSSNLSQPTEPTKLSNLTKLEKPTELKKLKLPELKQLCRYNNISGYSKWKKEKFLEVLSGKDIEFIQELTFDRDQQALLDKFDEPPKKILISAGPGAGKTTMLLEILKKVLEPEKSFVFISFNSEVEQRIKTLVKTTTKIPLLTKKASILKKGVRIATFHKLAYSIVASTSNVRFVGMDEMIEKATLRLDLLEMFDYVFIDEAHDISEDILDFVQRFSKKAHHLILAGDPRQEINSGSSWFTRLLNEEKENVHLLSFNHRSGSRIVRLLNKYSKEFFSYSHIPQESTFNHRGTIQKIASNQQTIAPTLYSLILKYKNPLIIAPLSASKFGLEKIVEQVNAILFENGHLSKLKILANTDKIIADQTFIYVAGSAKIKGLERRNVILINFELDYSNMMEDRLFKRRFFIALSRARRNLIILAHRPIANQFFESLFKNKSMDPTKDCPISGDRPIKENLVSPNLSMTQFYNLTEEDFRIIDKPLTEIREELSQGLHLRNLTLKKGLRRPLYSLRGNVYANLDLVMGDYFVNDKNEIVLVEEENLVDKVLIYASELFKDAKGYDFKRGKVVKINLSQLKSPFFDHYELPLQILRFDYFMKKVKVQKNFKRVKIPSLEGKKLITFDLETYQSYPKKGALLLEIGGLAFTSSGKILSLIYDKGLSNDDPMPVGLTYESAEEAHLSSEDLYQKSKDWAAQFNSQEISLKWAAQMSDYLIIDAAPAEEIDVMKIYAEWRNLNNINRSFQDGHRSLSDCAFDLFAGTIPFRAHCAFEDAAMTMLCFLAMIEEERYD